MSKKNKIPSRDLIIESLSHFYDAFYLRVDVWIKPEIEKVPLESSELFKYTNILYDYCILNEYTVQPDDEIILYKDGAIEAPAWLTTAVSQLYSFWVTLTHHDFYIDHFHKDKIDESSNYSIFSRFVVKSLTKFRTDFPFRDGYLFWNLSRDDIYRKADRDKHITAFTDSELAILADTSEDVIRNKDANLHKKAYMQNRRVMTTEIQPLKLQRSVKSIEPPEFQCGVEYFKGKRIHGRDTFRSYQMAMSILLRSPTYLSCQFMGPNFYLVDDSNEEDFSVPPYTDRKKYAQWIKNCGIDKEIIEEELASLGLTPIAIRKIYRGEGSMNLQLHHLINLSLSKHAAFTPFE